MLISEPFHFFFFPVPVPVVLSVPWNDVNVNRWAAGWVGYGQSGSHRWFV